jgi:hypothetical protein
MAGSAPPSLPIPRLQLFYVAIERMLDSVISTALSQSEPLSDEQSDEKRQRLIEWKERVMVSLFVSAWSSPSIHPPLTFSPLLLDVMSCAL